MKRRNERRERKKFRKLQHNTRNAFTIKKLRMKQTTNLRNKKKTKKLWPFCHALGEDFRCFLYVLYHNRRHHDPFFSGIFTIIIIPFLSCIESHTMLLLLYVYRMAIHVYGRHHIVELFYVIHLRIPLRFVRKKNEWFISEIIFV